ncbi:MMPL family transporter [Actinospica robiniae]|uniref:MMPL family transporter n=1 Tax=Actinospica robiniae TaxID=304901 RepID=UPI000423CF68|nr:MMPL family transporter [Actinospica robiniae]
MPSIQNSVAARLGRLSTRRPALLCVSWLIVILIGLAVGGQVTSRFDGNGTNVTASESYQAGRFLSAHDPEGDQITALVAGTEVTASGVRAQVDAAVTAVRAIPGVTAVSTPYPDGVSRDGQALAVKVAFAADLSDDAEGNALDAVYDRFHQISAPQVYVSGGPLLNQQMNHGIKKSLQLAEELSLPIILIGLFLVFGSFLAGLLPLAVSLAGISSSLLILLGFSHLTSLSQYALTIVTMIGLGVGVDYSLLIVSRFREERQRTWDKRVAAARAAAGAGRTVLFSGLTVTISSLGLCFFDNSFLRSIGLATASVVLVDMLAALTLLPALLALCGLKIRQQESRDTGVFTRLANLAAKLRVGVVVVFTALLVALAVPLGGLHLSNGDARWLPSSTEGRQEFTAATAHFGSSSSSPVEVLVRGTGPQYSRFASRISTLPQVAAATSTPLASGGTLVELAPSGGDASTSGLALVREIRADRGDLDVQVTGTPAQVLDFEGMLRAGAPWAIGFVCLTILALLFAFTGSLLIPIKTLITTGLSLGAALGIVTLVFQQGHGAGLFGTTGLGSLDLVTVPCVAAIAFGLAMDYEIFILGRVREAYLADPGRPRAAVALGLQRSGRIVTSAAVLIAVVFGCFMAGGNAVIGQIGLGLTLAVLIDATLMRMLLVPATMALLGDAAWWAPAPLRRLHRRYGLSEADSDETPAEPAAAEATVAG